MAEIIPYRTASPTLLQEKRRQLKTLAICFYIWGSMMIAGMIVPLMLFHGDRVFQRLLLGIVLYGLLCIISARCIQTRRARWLSIGVAAITILSVPLGTILGIFTLLVLNNTMVVAMYHSQTLNSTGEPI